MRATIRNSRKPFITLSIVLFGLIMTAVMAFAPNNIIQASAMSESADAVAEHMNDFAEMNGLAEEGLDFADNLVTVTLAKPATWRNYSVESFADVRAIALDELTSYTSSWVRNREMRIPTQQKMRINKKIPYLFIYSQKSCLQTKYYQYAFLHQLKKTAEHRQR